MVQNITTPKTVIHDGQTYAYDKSDVRTETYTYSDYQGPDVEMKREFIKLPDGSTVTINEWPARDRY